MVFFHHVLELDLETVVRVGWICYKNWSSQPPLCVMDPSRNLHHIFKRGFFFKTYLGQEWFLSNMDELVKIMLCRLSVERDYGITIGTSARIQRNSRSLAKQLLPLSLHQLSWWRILFPIGRDIYLVCMTALVSKLYEKAAPFMLLSPRIDLASTSICDSYQTHEVQEVPDFISIRNSETSITYIRLHYFTSTMWIPANDLVQVKHKVSYAIPLITAISSFRRSGQHHIDFTICNIWVASNNEMAISRT